MFGNSNSLPISLILSLSRTIKGLHWDQIPGDNDNDVGARGILYLLIFQQLGQLVRWSWGYHVLLAPAEKYEEEEQHANAQIERGEYRDDPDEDDSLLAEDVSNSRDTMVNSSITDSGQQSPNLQKYAPSLASVNSNKKPHVSKHPPELMATPANGNVLPRGEDSDPGEEHITSFPSIRSTSSDALQEHGPGIKGVFPRVRGSIARLGHQVRQFTIAKLLALFHSLPPSTQRGLATGGRGLQRFVNGVWEFMNPPLWAMLVAIIVASVPALQHLFFSEGSFINNSVTRAVGQSGGVAVPLILVVLGANLARNTLPPESHHTIEDDKEERKILIAALISRMLLPTIIMAPILALAAKYIPISILDDPIFVIVCFLLTGAPSALQLAQICQINGVYMGVMSRLLFQSYVVW